VISHNFFLEKGGFSTHSNQQAANQMEILTSHDRPSVDAPWQQ
jgi:hypothetical protein